MSEILKDPIVEEIREVRRKIMQECDNDLDKLSERLMRVEEQHGGKVVHRKPVPLGKAKSA
ncbi:MAG: hypothetical protein A2289_11240 [Deltaproteobacteria bacterium RIFOXYA12_FULL_58_15]|nr:MAG: hypothetical protein A2289_11240 [Deltaproteobacteria bacterium RIFOXYA12_FULL_58_15]OGR14986.1 MAG: hypothetical protein A2341_17725 [Deltaproteobacteria bacterium RIFOXYB12_FULL_58_9]